MNHRQKLAGEKSNAVSKFFVYLLMAVLTAVIVVPVAWVFMASVKQNSEFYGNPFALPEGLYLQNFADAWTKARMGDYFFTSIMITAVALCILLVVALPAAYVLSRYKFKGSKLLNTCFMAGLFINVSYIVVPIFLMFVSGDKLVKRLFGHSVFLNNPFIVALVLAATTLPFTIYLLSSYLSTLPKDYEEAAYVVGAMCAAPSVLGRMGLLRGKRATAYPGWEKYLEGAEVVETEAVVDGQIITARGPRYCFAYGVAILSQLEGRDKAAEVARGLLLDEQVEPLDI